MLWLLEYYINELVDADQDCRIYFTYTRKGLTLNNWKSKQSNNKKHYFCISENIVFYTICLEMYVAM